tara:strand:- start:4871 stop:5548 length:678 start_codon:yes stop_codon:yes gene_type:complete
MVYKIFKKSPIFIIIFFSLNSYSNVIYDKQNIIISELDLEYYKQLHYQRFNEEINISKALKNLVKIKKLIENLKKTNPVFVKKIDEIIYNGIAVENIKSQTILDILRYFNIRNEFIYDYLNNNFKLNDLKYVFNTFERLEIPISDNKCLTIIELVDLKDNIEFINVFFRNIETQKNDYEIFINNTKYDVCIDSRLNGIIEKEIFRFIELKIENDFDRFVYEKQDK